MAKLPKRKIGDTRKALDLSPAGSLSDDIDYWKDAYIKSKRGEGRSEHTLRAYDDALKPFARFCAEMEKNGETMRDINAMFINYYIIFYLHELAEFYRGERTVRGRGGALRDSPDNLSDEDYDVILSNEIDEDSYDDVHIAIPKRFQKTVEHRLTTLKQLLAFISKRTAYAVDYAKEYAAIAKHKIEERDTPTLRLGELRSLRDICLSWPQIYPAYVKSVPDKYRIRKVQRHSRFVAIRNAFVVLLMSYTGLRASEALSVKWECFDREVQDSATGRWYYDIVVVGKGSKKRTVPAPRDPIKPLMKMLRPLSGTGAISSAKGSKHPLTYSALHQYMKHLFGAAGLDFEGFHSIRRGFATEFIALGGTVEVLAKYLGHESIQLTYSTYIEGNDELLKRGSVH